MDGSLAVVSDPVTVPSRADSSSLVTSPMGPSLVDSGDELIATRLPGYLSNFETYKVSALQFSSIHLSHFSFHFH